MPPRKPPFVDGIWLTSRYFAVAGPTVVKIKICTLANVRFFEGKDEAAKKNLTTLASHVMVGITHN